VLGRENQINYPKLPCTLHPGLPMFPNTHFLVWNIESTGYEAIILFQEVKSMISNHPLVYWGTYMYILHTWCSFHVHDTHTCTYIVSRLDCDHMCDLHPKQTSYKRPDFPR
jgi:hypothetical protein